MEPRNWFQGINSASLCSPAGRYDNPIPTRFLAPIECLKIPALISNAERFKPAFAERDKKQTMIDLRGFSTNWCKNQFYVPPQAFLGYGLCIFIYLSIYHTLGLVYTEEVGDHCKKVVFARKLESGGGRGEGTHKHTSSLQCKWNP